jgi:hypothetical protein
VTTCNLATGSEPITHGKVRIDVVTCFCIHAAS